MSGREDEKHRILNYSGGNEPARSPRISTMSQFFIGLLSYISGVTVLTAGSYAITGDAGGAAGGFLCGYVFVLMAIFIPGEILRSRFGWKGFIPGALTGVGITLLIVPFFFLSVCAGAARGR
jgi:hypothetical protein